MIRRVGSRQRGPNPGDELPRQTQRNSHPGEYGLAFRVRDLSNTLALLQKEVVLALFLPIIQQLRLALAREGPEVDHRCGIGGDDMQDLTALHAQEGDFGLQYGQWAVQTRGIKLHIEIPHRRSSIRRGLAIMAWRSWGKKRCTL